MSDISMAIVGIIIGISLTIVWIESGTIQIHGPRISCGPIKQPGGE